VLFVGVDAIADNLRDASRRGPENVLFGRLALEDAPGELVAFADALTVLFPWGSLLRALAEPQAEGLARLRAICKPGAEVRFLFETQERLEAAYRAAGLDLCARELTIEEARALPTTWAKKLGYSGHPRSFREFRGRAF
jgi:16S rRNA (adenine(1408)-N(1))-methyltransferase